MRVSAGTGPGHHSVPSYSRQGDREGLDKQQAAPDRVVGMLAAMNALDEATRTVGAKCIVEKLVDMNRGS